MNFVKTSDEETAKLLRSQNYNELSKEGSFFVFINKTGKQEFADNKKIVYTNKISV